MLESTPERTLVPALVGSMTKAPGEEFPDLLAGERSEMGLPAPSGVKTERVSGVRKEYIGIAVVGLSPFLMILTNRMQ